MIKTSFTGVSSGAITTSWNSDELQKILDVGTNIDKLIPISDSLADLLRLVNDSNFVDIKNVGINIDPVINVGTNISAVTALSSINTAISTLYNNLNKIITVSDSQIAVNNLNDNILAIQELASISTALQSLFNDKATLDAIGINLNNLKQIHTYLNDLNVIFTNLNTLIDIANNTSNIIQASIDSKVNADNAQQSAIYAENSAETAQMLILGAFDTPPTTLHNGKPIPEGSIYYDTLTNQIKVYNGSAWVLAISYSGTSLVASFNNRVGNVTLTKTDVDNALGFIAVDTTNADNIISGTLNRTRLPNEIDSNTTGNAATASKLASTKNITLSGDVNGSVLFDGSLDVNINTIVLDDSHNHTVSTITDIQDNYVNKLTTSPQQIASDLTILGNVFIKGTTTSVDSTTVTTADNQITLNSGEVGTGVTAGKSGIEIDRGTLINYEFVFDEVTDTFRIGEIGTTTAVACREDVPIANGIAVWDNVTSKFITTRQLDVDTLSLNTTSLINTELGNLITEVLI